MTGAGLRFPPYEIPDISVGGGGVSGSGGGGGGDGGGGVDGGDGGKGDVDV